MKTALPVVPGVVQHRAVETDGARLHIEQGHAAVREHRHVAVVARHGSYAHLLRDACEQAVALIEVVGDIGTDARALDDLGVDGLEASKQGVEAIDGIGDADVRLRAHVLDRPCRAVERICKVLRSGYRRLRAQRILWCCRILLDGIAELLDRRRRRSVQFRIGNRLVQPVESFDDRLLRGRRRGCAQHFFEKCAVGRACDRGNPYAAVVGRYDIGVLARGVGIVRSRHVASDDSGLLRRRRQPGQSDVQTY